MADLLDLASMDSYVYTPSNLELLPAGWETLPGISPDVDPSVGFYAQAFKNLQTGEIVIAIRGTVPTLLNGSSMLEDLKLGSVSKYAPTLNAVGNDAIAFAQAVADANPGATITITGHSLGGYAAQAALVRLTQERPSNVSAVTFNAPGLPSWLLGNASPSSFKCYHSNTWGDAINDQGGAQIAQSMWAAITRCWSKEFLVRSLSHSVMSKEGCATRLRSRMVLVASVIVPALLCALLACSGSSPPSAEVKPGDRDYPTPNPHPGDIVQVSALIPPTLKIAFQYGYSASPRAGGLMGSGTECQRTIGLAVTAPFYVNLPVRMVAEGNLYSGNVEVDKFEPGRCEWTFDGIGYRAVSPLSYGNELARYGETVRNHAVTLDIWCIMAGIDSKAPELCGGLHFLSAIEHLVSPEFVASIPQSEQDDTEANIGPDTTSVTVRFHDLNGPSTLQNKKE